MAELCTDNNIFEATDISRSVTISLGEYLRLKKESEELHLVLLALFKGAELDYTGNGLRFDDCLIKPLLQIIEPQEYETLLAHEKAKEEEKDD